MGAGSTKPNASSFELISDICDPDRTSDRGSFWRHSVRCDQTDGDHPHCGSNHLQLPTSLDRSRLPLTDALQSAGLVGLADPLLTVSERADRYRVLSASTRAFLFAMADRHRKDCAKGSGAQRMADPAIHDREDHQDSRRSRWP